MQEYHRFQKEYQEEVRRLERENRVLRRRGMPLKAKPESWQGPAPDEPPRFLGDIKDSYLDKYLGVHEKGPDKNINAPLLLIVSHDLLQWLRSQGHKEMRAVLHKELSACVSCVCTLIYNCLCLV